MARATQLAIALAILAVAARLIWIDESYIDTWSWRQSDVAAIARNYSENGFHFAHPQINWAGNAPGYVGTEFPLLPFVAALSYKLVGVHESIGRLETLVLFAISLPFFFLLVRELFGATAGVWALFFYSFTPLSVFASREFMPDVPSLSFALVGLYFFKRWIDNERLGFFLASACAISLSILLKAPNAIIGVPLAVFAFQHLRKPPLRFGAAFHRFALWLFAAIALIPPAVWYWHAYSIAQNFYPHHFFGGGGVQIVSANAYERIAVFITTSSLTPVLVIFAVAGLWITKSTRLRQGYGAAGARVFRWWLGAMLLFIIVAGKGNRHPWYQLPLVPIGAVFAGASCAFAAEKIRTQRVKTFLSLALVFLFAAAAFDYVRPFYRPWASHLRAAGLELQHTTPQRALIIAADHGDPTLFYYAERRGWHLPENDAIYNGDPASAEQLIDDVAQLRRAGATHVVFVSTTFWFLDRFPSLAEYLAQTATLSNKTPEFAIYELKPKE
jgi:4-amino-4-deoxy-L-arabinose transferase-like glycosyltransferase